MSFTPLVDTWHGSEETRARIRPGWRWYLMEKELGEGQGLADMTPNRHHWRYRETPDGESGDRRAARQVRGRRRDVDHWRAPRGRQLDGR